MNCHHGNRRRVRRLLTAGVVIAGISASVTTVALASAGSHANTARAEAQRLLKLLSLPAGTEPSAGVPTGADVQLLFAPSVPSVPHLIDLPEFFTAPGTPATFIASLRRPTGSRQGDSGASPGAQWTSFEFGPIPRLVAVRELDVSAVQLRSGTVAVRVDSQTAPLPTLPGNGRGPGAVRIVESGMTLGSFAFRLRCDPPGGTVPNPSRICSAIRANPALLYSFPGPDHSCPPGGPTVSLTGTWNHQPVRSNFSVCTGGQEQPAGDWAALLPSQTTQATVHPDGGIGLVTLGQNESTVLDLLRGVHKAPPICDACTRTFGAGYYASSGAGPGQPIGWTIAFAHKRVQRIENNASVLTINGDYTTRGFPSLRRALHDWSVRTCAHARELIHSSAAGTTVVVYHADFERVIVATRPVSCR